MLCRFPVPAASPRGPEPARRARSPGRAIGSAGWRPGRRQAGSARRRCPAGPAACAIAPAASRARTRWADGGARVRVRPVDLAHDLYSLGTQGAAEVGEVLGGELADAIV